MSDPLAHPNRPRFDPTVNLGHVLTALMMGAALCTMWVNMRVTEADHESRIKSLEADRTETRESINRLADAESSTARAQDRLAVTLEYLAKQSAQK